MTIPYNFFDITPRDCWVNIDVSQLEQNVRRLEAVAQRPVLVAVKGNAYGHGYEIAAKAFVKGGAKYLGVANYAEGLFLKQLGIAVPILIIGGILPEEMVLAAAAGLEFFVFRQDHVEALRQMTREKPIRVHIKVDTGMGRLGCYPEETAAIGEALKSIPNVVIAGLATHFAKAGPPGSEFTETQTDKFDQAIAALAAIGIRPEIIHASKSGTIDHPRPRYDMVRLGIIAYGVAPAVEGFVLPEGVLTALTWHARITSTKILPKGHGVSYGANYVMPKDGRIGILPVGYADGYRRLMDVNSVLIDGQERKIIGSINMDQCIVDLDGFPDIAGKQVDLIGRQGGKKITVQYLAQRWNTNSYSVYTGIHTRVPRRAVGV